MDDKKMQLPPLQFDFRHLWFTKRREILSTERVSAALEDMRRRWRDIAEFAYEELVEADPEQALEEYELDLHIGQVKVKDIWWLQKQFSSIDLADVSLAIAEELHPEKSWEIIEYNDIGVVADSERTIVMDMKFGHELSAGASLTIAHDTKFIPSPAVREEVEAWYGARIEAMNRGLERARADLARFAKEGEVISLLPSTPAASQDDLS